jgi:peptidoglycan hydrolase-like protein with peptidoglycan-binding domain
MSQLAMIPYWVSWAANLAILSPARVGTIQEHLAKLGYFRHLITGVYELATTAAVEAFQNATRLPATGAWGPTTAAVVAGQLRYSALALRRRLPTGGTPNGVCPMRSGEYD